MREFVLVGGFADHLLIVDKKDDWGGRGQGGGDDVEEAKAEAEAKKEQLR